MKVRCILQKLNLIRIFDNYKNTYSLILKEVCQFVFYIFYYMYQMVKNIIKEKKIINVSLKMPHSINP